MKRKEKTGEETYKESRNKVGGGKGKRGKNEKQKEL